MNSVSYGVNVEKKMRELGKKAKKDAILSFQRAGLCRISLDFLGVLWYNVVKIVYRMWYVVCRIGNNKSKFKSPGFGREILSTPAYAGINSSP